MLPARLLFFAATQAIVALLLVLSGKSDGWQTAAAWWPVTVVLTNLVCIILLRALFSQERLRYEDIFRFEREKVKTDLLTMLGVLLLAGPIAFLPNVLLGNWLLGSQEAALQLLLPPLPRSAVVLAALLFPITVALSELPTYFAYVMPRLEAQTGRRWLSLLFPSLFLAAQHMALPLRFDGHFLLWRLLMFMPFSLFVGLLLRWRPRLLPYVVIVHGVMDLATVLTIPTIS
jgi:hypothetical protein